MQLVDRGHGTPVVMMPGVQGRWEWASPAVDALAEHCRVLTFSLCDEPTSGFACDPRCGIENYLSQLEAVFDQAMLRDAVLMGVSYSGPIAAEFAARHPDKVRALVLVSPLPPDWTLDRRARFYLRAPMMLSPIFLADASLRGMREIRAALPALGDRLRFSLDQTRRVLRAFISPSRMATRLRWLEAYGFGDPTRISRPVLLITGEPDLDRVVPPDVTRRYLAALPNARHVVIPRTGHLGLVTKPQTFAALVAAFLDEQADARRASA